VKEPQKGFQLTLHNKESDIYTAINFKRDDVSRWFIWNAFRDMLKSNDKESSKPNQTK
jgi:hypothetical protein